MSKIGIRHSLLVCSIIWLTSLCTQASMWSDPDWEKMLKESESIALVQVIEGGKFTAKVNAVKTFKGKVAREFFVTGYNDEQWPKEAIEEQSLQKREQYYLFLRRQKEDPDYLADLATEGGKTGDAELKKFLELANTDALWYVWTPSAGDLRVKNDRVHYSLLRTSYPDSAPLRDRGEFEQLLKAAIAYQADATTDSGLLERTRRAIRKHSKQPVPPRAQESDLAHSLAAYQLLGGRAYDQVFEAIAAGKDDRARFMVARLLGGIAGERARKLLLTMLSDTDSLVQGEVVRQLAKSDSMEVGAILLERLAGAGEGGIGPQGIMDPVQNRIDGGKIEIIRALGEMKYEAAAPALTALLKDAQSAYELKIIAGALEKMGNRDYASTLEKSLREGKIEVHEIAAWARDNRLTGLRSVFERFLLNPPDGTLTIHLSSVVEALGIIGDDATAAKLTAFLEKCRVKKVAEVHDQTLSQELIGALGALRYKPAHAAVEQAFFYWFGVDSAFATKPALLTTKEQLEHEIESDAKKYLEEFREVSAVTLVFLENRTALVDGSETQAKYGFALQVDIRSPEHPELKAESLRAGLEKALAPRGGTIGVTRWNGNFGNSSGNDERVDGRFDSLFLWRWAQFVQATRDPEDLHFAKFLLDSGLATRWSAQNSITGVFGTAPIE